MNDELKSLISAFLSGVIHIIIGHPFDTIKTLQQSNNQKIIYNNLYRGLFFPVLQNALINSITFGSNHYFKKYNNQYISYSYCGFLSTILCTPLDNYKILKQYNIPYKINMKSFLQSYKHTNVVALRELPATIIYFATYDHSRYYGIPIYISGAFAGLTSGIITHPIDTIKTRIQGKECSTINEAFKKGSLFNGISISVIRSVTVNAVNFSLYEFFMRKIN